MSTHSLDTIPNDFGESATSKNLAPESLACNGCRKAKLRCTRDRPSCSHCRKTGNFTHDATARLKVILEIGSECIYETKRVKPGLKAGAVENLHRRLDALEKFVHERDSTRGQHSQESPRCCQPSAALDILALLAKELPKLVGDDSIHKPPSESIDNADTATKRRRIDSDTIVESAIGDTCPQLPNSKVVEAVVDAYFLHIHPWIPMIHQGRFRQRLSNPNERYKLEVVLCSITISATRFVADEELATDSLVNMRRWLICRAMDSLSIESLQALIILAWVDIGDGNIAKAWSIIGSLTRTVEYSQLSQEHEDKNGHSICQPYQFLEYPEDWTAVEERRRIFWNVFNLDRFCSVTMGWNTSLTSDDVHRRLPCDGHLWRKQKSVVTPYFGIWDRSTGRIGNPIAFLPLYDSPGHSVPDLDKRHQSEPSPVGTQAQFSSADMSTVGAFAYCIEATESMSRITSYFLQQKVCLNDEKTIGAWLTRFKELDLRLVHWKMLLPQKWKTHMERQTIVMDPNLTTAHLTHNASMILLHQVIAYPPANWLFRNRLPSSWSAETCQSAGVEIARIAQKYLTNSNHGSPLGNQFAFCLFVAGRMMLVHWRFHLENHLLDEFWSLIQSLEEMSMRWNALLTVPPKPRDLAAKYGSCLKGMYEMCTRDTSFRPKVMDYTKEIDHYHSEYNSLRSQPFPVSQQTNSTPYGEQWPVHSPGRARYASEMNMTVPVSPHEVLKSNMAAPLAVDTGGMETTVDGLDHGDFNNIPQMELDQHFINMDRIIAFDDGSMFAAALDNGSW